MSQQLPILTDTREMSDSSRTSFANSYLILVAFQTISLHIGSICCNQNTQEHMLIDHLIGNYDSTIRPVQNHSSSMKVYFRLRLTQVLDLSEKDQALTTNMLIEQVLDSHRQLYCL